jgi:hypothetical protein
MRKQLISRDQAVPCAVQPRQPCSDCPFARTALEGWLGGYTPEEWVMVLHSERIIPCHTMIGPQCAGAAIYRANVGKLPRDRRVLRLPCDEEVVFAWAEEFMDHHRKMPMLPGKDRR